MDEKNGSNATTPQLNNSVQHFHTQSREYRTEVKDHKGHIINEAILEHKQYQYPTQNDRKNHLGFKMRLIRFSHILFLRIISQLLNGLLISLDLSFHVFNESILFTNNVHEFLVEVEQVLVGLLHPFHTIIHLHHLLVCLVLVLVLMMLFLSLVDLLDHMVGRHD